jgi:UDP-N-acetylglucosamine diphosphorylase / glucose-1-phosphate thymidylyltransferase / UDP-N-acetylgalactosamine diphosphorylase / glucosamine-1-phosphate N-acetyltransferase / galactosamine-1-phosphate N-acetyltransferase
MIILSDKNFRENLFPFTHTRHTADIRIGMLTIREKWELLTGKKVSVDENANGIHIPANIIPTKENFEIILDAANKNVSLIETETIKIISFPWHIFQLNDYALRKDYDLLCTGKTSSILDDSNKVISPENIFVEEGTKITLCSLNASTGPIYIAKNAEIMEGSMIRGPFYLGNNSVVKMGSKIYGGTTIGPNCVVGGEIKNSVLFANSNKAHDGYLGDSVLGEWCNLGAGTSNSNVKNNGGTVGYTLQENSQEIFAGNKAGLLMGDYSRVAINTSFNTGSVVGVCCNVFGEVMPAKFISNFTWGKEKYIFDKAIQDIINWKVMKGQDITKKEITNLEKLYTQQ